MWQKKRGSKVICIGTTTLRALESSADAIGMVMPTHSSETDIFIKPGYEFRVVDSLVTNFHLPKSTLFVLVSAFTSLEFMGILYSEAISNSYRFFSYGDACYIERFCS
ncbi:MAG: S-adenosylmethionine:tRNA ribosyltransferase-isomerase [Candidatus Lariskella arthropodorum]